MYIMYLRLTLFNKTQYGAVPQADIDDAAIHKTNPAHDEEAHGHSSVPHPLQNNATEPHLHCEACDKLQEKKNKREAEKYFCKMTAITVIAAFFFATLLGIGFFAT